MPTEYAVFLFFVIALFYSSVGFGGGSSYLAFLSILIADFYEIRTIGLILNLVVVSLGTYTHYRKGYIQWQSFWPFITLSIVFAFWGARFRLSETTFFIILRSSLIASALFIFYNRFRDPKWNVHSHLPKRIVLGSGLGFLSGLVGIGGGVFLSPTLNIIGWKNPHVVAALASVYILFNSAAGLTGLISSGGFKVDFTFAAPLIASVFFGGLIGSNLSASKLNIHVIRGLTALLVGYVGLRLVFLHGFDFHI